MTPEERFETMMEAIFNADPGTFAADGNRNRLRNRAIAGFAREEVSADEFAELNETQQIRSAFRVIKALVRERANNTARRDLAQEAALSALEGFEEDGE